VARHPWVVPVVPVPERLGDSRLPVGDAVCSVDALRHALVASASGPRTTDVPLIDAWSAHIALRAQALH
jgi:hypothetical protein